MSSTCPLPRQLLIERQVNDARTADKTTAILTSNIVAGGIDILRVELALVLRLDGEALITATYSILVALDLQFVL